MKKLSNNQKHHLKIFLLIFILVIIGIFLILMSMDSNFLYKFSYHPLKGFSADLAIGAAILFGLSIALYVFRLLIKHLNPKTMHYIWKLIDKTRFKLKEPTKHKITGFLINEIKTIIKFFAKIAQKLHVLLAGVGFFIIMFHVYIFLHLGFKFTFGYLLGAADAIILLILFLSGILRMFNKGLKSHKLLGIIFVVLMALHIIFV